MTTEVTPGALGLGDGLGPLPDVADAARVLAWAREKPRRPANTAFTAGPERQAAYWIEWAEAAERERWIAICRDRAADKEPPHKDYEGYKDGWLDACNEVMWAGERPNARLSGAGTASA